MTAKKRTTLSLNKDNLEFAKQCGLNISSFCDDMLDVYVKFVNASRREILEEVNRIEYEENALRTRKEALRQVFNKSFDEDTYDSKKSCKEYERLVETGEFVEVHYNELIKATGLYRTPLQRLAQYCRFYEKFYPNREDKHMFIESIDYLIRRYNEDNPQSKIKRQGGYL